jgi:hypothetical protein
MRSSKLTALNLSIIFSGSCLNILRPIRTYLSVIIAIVIRKYNFNVENYLIYGLAPM